jgi:16S rRNA (guanine(966)-N(2))-methyltransferase RsmD
LRLTGGTANNREIKTRKGLDTRPTSSKARAALFDILQGRIAGARWLDLFGGNGTMGLEALSRGAAHVTYVEKDRGASRVIQDNLSLLKFADRATVHTADVPRWLAGKPEQPYDIAFADPPWAAGIYETVLTRLATAGWVQPGGMIVAEHRKSEPLPETFGAWQRTRTALYGDTAFSFYQVMAGDPPSPAAADVADTDL